MKQLTSIGTIMVAPAIYNLIINVEGSENELGEMGKWGWVNVLELRDCINTIFEEKGIPDRIDTYDPIGIFERYGLLCSKTTPERPLYTWVKPHAYSVAAPELPDSDWINLFIPSGWSQRILSVVKSGIIKITTVQSHYDFSDIQWAWEHARPIGPHRIYQLLGHNHDGKKTIISIQGSGQPNVTTKEAPSLTCI